MWLVIHQITVLETTLGIPDARFFGSIAQPGSDSTQCGQGVKNFLLMRPIQCGVFLLKGWSMHELQAEDHFCMQISIEQKHTVCAQWICLIHNLAQREFPRLSCSLCFFLVCQSFVSYDCFYRTRSFVRNRCHRTYCIKKLSDTFVLFMKIAVPYHTE